MDNYSLDVTQEQAMLDCWNKTPENPPSLSALAKAVFKQDFPVNSKEVEVIKKALAKHDLRSQTKTGKLDIELSEAHKDFVIHNAKSMNPLEMAKTIFSNTNLTNLNAETKAVANFVKSLNPQIVLNIGAARDVPESTEYRPPMNIDQILVRVGKYVDFVTKRDKLTASQRKLMDVLMSYLSTYRFVSQMSSYASEEERKLCEDAFIRYTYDKPDLTQEEVDQYIMLANEIVMGRRIQRRSEGMQVRLEEINGQDEESRKYSMGLVEAIGKAQLDYDKCIGRQQDLLGDLKMKRSARLDKQVKDNASVLNLVQLWQQEETRKQMIEIGKKEQKKIADEVQKLTSVADIKARIMGLSKDETMYG